MFQKHRKDERIARLVLAIVLITFSTPFVWIAYADGIKSGLSPTTSLIRTLELLAVVVAYTSVLTYPDKLMHWFKKLAHRNP